MCTHERANQTRAAEHAAKCVFIIADSVDRFSASAEPVEVTNMMLARKKIKHIEVEWSDQSLLLKVTDPPSI